MDWKVYYGEGFWRHRGRSKFGTEIPVNKVFTWHGNVWHVPSVYACGQGLVVDFCVEIEPEKIKEFLVKVEMYGEREEQWSDEVRDEMHRTNPTDIEFRAKVTLNKKELHQKNSYGFGWIPEELRPEGFAGEGKAEQILEYYGLDRNKGWSFQRASFPWATVRKPSIQSLKVTMEARPVAITGRRFHTPEVGEHIIFTHPVTGVEHTLTVQECESQEMNMKPMEQVHHGEYEFPTHYQMLHYIISPDLSGQKFVVQDSTRGDGPTAVFFEASGAKQKPHAACSSLHFEPVRDVEWKMMFYETMCEDMDVELI